MQSAAASTAASGYTSPPSSCLAPFGHQHHLPHTNSLQPSKTNSIGQMPMSPTYDKSVSITSTTSTASLDNGVGCGLRAVAFPAGVGAGERFAEAEARAHSFVNSFMFPFLSCVRLDAPFEIYSSHKAARPFTQPQHSYIPSMAKAGTATLATSSDTTFLSPSLIAPHHRSSGEPRSPRRSSPPSKCCNCKLNYHHSFPFSMVTLQSLASISPAGSFTPSNAVVLKLNDHDVLCGRGRGIGDSHEGNARFHQIVASQRAYYNTLTKKQKMSLARQIVDLIRFMGGRFLARDTSTGGWVDVGMARSCEKAAQALRETNFDTNNKESQENISPNLIDFPGTYIKHPSPNGYSLPQHQRGPDSFPAHSDATEKMGNSSNDKIATPILILPPRLQGMYGSALRKLRQPQQPSVRPAQIPMPCGDFPNLYQPPFDGTVVSCPFHALKYPQPQKPLLPPPRGAVYCHHLPQTRTVVKPYMSPCCLPSQPIHSQPRVASLQDTEKPLTSPLSSEVEQVTPAKTEISPLIKQTWKNPRCTVSNHTATSLLNNDTAMRAEGSAFSTSCSSDSSSGLLVVDNVSRPLPASPCSSSVSSLASADDDQFYPVESTLSLQQRIIRRTTKTSAMNHTGTDESLRSTLLSRRQSQSSRLMDEDFRDDEQGGLVALSIATFLRLDDEGMG